MKLTAPALVKRFGYLERGVYLPPRHVSVHGLVRWVGISHEQDPASYDWHGLKRGSYEFTLLQHCTAGKGMLTFEGQNHEITPGTTMLLYIPHDHRYFLPVGQTWEFFYICLSGSEITRLWREMIDRSGPLVQLARDSTAMAHAINICGRVCAGRLDSPFLSSSLAYALTMALLEETVPQWSADAAPEFVQKVEGFCQRNYRKPIGVEDMARVAGMSRYHFSRRFRQARGISPGRYLSDLRLQQAVRMIQDSSLSIREIAERCGYTDVNYFFKVFHKNFGMSTRAFRTTRLY